MCKQQFKLVKVYLYGHVGPYFHCQFGAPAAPAARLIWQLKRLLITLMIPASLALGTDSASADQILNGSSIYSDLGKNQFVAALYLDTKNRNPQAIQSMQGKKRMEIRVLNNFSKRRWFNLWMQSISINNSRESFSDSAQELVELMQAIKSAPQTGDMVEYILTPGEGTSLKFNGTELLSGLPAEVFDLLLHTWIGAIPPTANFKNEILGKQPNRQALELQETVTTDPQRIALAASWLLPPKPRAVSNPETAPKSVTNAKSTTPPPSKVAESEQATLATTGDAETDSKSAPLDVETAVAASNTSSETSSPQPQQDPVPEQLTVAASTKGASPDSATETVTTNEESHNSSQLKSPTINKTSDEENVDFSVAEVLAMRDYTPILVQKIFKEITYPGRAIVRNWEGTVRASVLVDRSGAVSKISVTQSSGYAILDKAAIRAIQRAAPFPPMPEAINARYFDLGVPITFQLK
jgi:TonB family protein